MIMLFKHPVQIQRTVKRQMDLLPNGFHGCQIQAGEENRQILQLRIIRKIHIVAALQTVIFLFPLITVQDRQQFLLTVFLRCNGDIHNTALDRHPYLYG